jgi:hypothetical protein
MSKLFAIGKARIRMMEKLGFDEKQSVLLGLNSLNIPCDEVKEEIIGENEILAEEAQNFTPLHTTLDDFKDEDTYKNVKEDYLNSTINKNPVYKSIKPRIGRMIIDKETGERKIVHDE